MPLKFFGLVVVCVSAIGVFFANKIISAAKKREASEREVIMFKLIGYLVLVAGVCAVVLPDFV